jgi:acyl carrier protein
MRSDPTSLTREDHRANHSSEKLDRIRVILLKHGRLGKHAMELAENDDLFAAGMTSLASVNVMLALESEFGVEFPDQMLSRSMFMSIGAISMAVQKAAGA